MQDVGALCFDSDEAFLGGAVRYSKQTALILVSNITESDCPHEEMEMGLCDLTFDIIVKDVYVDLSNQTSPF